MNSYTIKVELISPLLLGSGVGWGGSLIDTDIVFDDYGLPYFPARRLKGMLRESALEVVEMFQQSGLGWFELSDVDHVFGKKGSAGGASIVFLNLYLTGYGDAVLWLEWALAAYDNILTKEAVLDALTEIRHQTAINMQDGIAEENSLRTLRVLNPGQTLAGSVLVDCPSKTVTGLLALACANLRRIGSKRTRGLGEVGCSLWENGRNVTQSVLGQLKGEHIHA